MWVAFRTLREGMTDHYEVVATRDEAEALLTLWSNDEGTYCAGIAGIQRGTDWFPVEVVA